jgi:WD40 repeat protein
MRLPNIPGFKPGLFRQLADWLFGYDFFISYAHKDGKNYPAVLEERLEHLGYKVFLDKEYYPGIDLDEATRRRVAMSRKLIVLVRPCVFESEWVRKEVEVYLKSKAETMETPILININDALGSAPLNAGFSKLVREQWLRIEEPLQHIDDIPTADCIDNLSRSFNATRQEKIRVRFLQAATVAFALLTAVAVWQAWAAIQARRSTVVERDRALEAQSRVMAAFANQQTDQITAVNAAPLALEALPDESASTTRPYTPEAEEALYAALFVRRDHASLHAANSRGKKMTVGIGKLSADGGKILTLGMLLAADQPKIWDTKTGRLISVINDRISDDVGSYFAGSGAAILTSSPSAGEIRLWDSESGKQIVFYKCPSEHPKLTSVDASSNRKNALLLCDGHLVRLVNLNNGSVRDVFHSDRELGSARFSSDGLEITVTENDNIIHIVRIEGSADHITIKEQSGPKIMGILSPNRYLVTVPAEEDDKSLLTIWDLKSRKKIASRPASINIGTLISRWRGVFSPDMQLVLAISPKPENTVRVLRLKDGTEAAVLSGHDGHVLSAVFSSDGQRIITASEDRTARIWDAKSGNELTVLRGHNWPVFSADISDDNAWIVTSTAGNGDEARIWRADFRSQLPITDCHGNWAMNGASFSQEGKHLVTFAGSIACVWDLASRTAVARFDQHKSNVLNASFSPDGQYVITASDDKTAAIWSARTGAVYKFLTGHVDAVVSAEFSPDGNRVVTASKDKTTRLWDAQNGEPSPITLDHPSNVLNAAFSRDGALIFSVAGKSIYLWNSNTGSLIRKLDNNNEVNHATISPDGKYIAAATGGITEDSGHAAVIWDINLREPITRLPVSDYVRHVAFSPNGLHLATSSDSIIVWDIARKAPIVLIPGDEDSGAAFIGAEFNHYGDTLVAVTTGSVSLWPQFEKTQDLVDIAKKTIARCLTPQERLIFKLDPAPPRWCITGPGREKEKYPSRWAGMWPYDGREWVDWFVAQDRGENMPMPTDQRTVNSP